MQINPLPFLFVPGMAGVGYALGGIAGVGAALLIWAGVVMLATAIVFLGRAFGERDAVFLSHAFGERDAVDEEGLDAPPG
jgi:hypothetical protein